MTPLGAASILAVTWVAQQTPEKLTSGSPYHPDPQHVCNRIHRALFTPWAPKDLQEGPRHREVLAVLDEFISAESSRRALEPIRALMLQRDLWALHDLIAAERPQSDSSEASRSGLRTRLAQAMATLALTEEQFRGLPDNYAQSVAAKKYAARHEGSSAPFLPADLFDQAGVWVRLSGNPPLAPGHTQAVLGRSHFQFFITIPGGRDATLAFVQDLNANHRSYPLRARMPEGASVALARRVVGIDTAGKMRLTPIVEGLQIRVLGVSGPGRQHVNAFKLDRLALFEGSTGGLMALGPDEEELPLAGPGQPDLANLYGPEKKGRGPALVSCLGCHHGPQAEHVRSFSRLASSTAGAEPLKVTSPEGEMEILSRWKQGQETWKLLEPWLKR